MLGDVDGTRPQDNPSARRPFRAEEAGEKGRGRRKSREETKSVPGDTVDSRSASAEEYGAADEKGRRDTGRKGRSQRPSGTKDASAKTGVDARDPPSGGWSDQRLPGGSCRTGTEVCPGRGRPSPR